MFFSKKLIITYILINSILLGFSQSHVKGKITDSSTGTILSNVTITNASTQESSISQTNGTFKVPKFGEYLFKKEGYLSKAVNLKKNTFYIIQLEINPFELNEVIIETNQIPKKLLNSSASVSIISSKDIKRSNNTDFAPVLNRVTGVFMQNGALNTNRITIRGIGSRNLFGTSKIRAYFNDIPLTNGSGETTIEDFELASLSRIEIIKGASSSIYGAGLGGVIHLRSQNALLNQTDVGTELSIGSFGLTKGIVQINHGSDKNSFRAIYSNTHSDGYRENNEYDRQTFTISTNHYINPSNELTFLASYVDLKAFIPSSLNETNYLNSPKSAAFTWKASRGFEDSNRGIFGVSWNHDFSQHIKQQTSIFSSFREAYEPRPFNILKENTFAIGMRSRLLGTSKLLNKKINWTVGGEFFKDTYKYQTFENLYKDFPPGNGSVEGDQLSNFKEKRNYYNIFIDSNFSITYTTLLSLGFNFNKTAYDLEDRFPSSPENPDQSGNFKFKNMLSPKFGISQLLSKDISVFSSISHGFSPISLNEILLPDGQINTDIKPETGWNFEIGTRGTILNKKLQFDMSIYRLDIKNLLVSRRTAEDEFIGINAGRTRHDGLELALNYTWFQKESTSINTFLNYSLNNFMFKDFIDDTNDFSGNDLTGVPSDVFNAGIDFNFAFGLYGNVNYQYVGSIPITDSNSLYSDSYSLTNLKMGYQSNLSKSLKLNIFFGVNNIFNEHYASQLLINASGFGGNAPRYYYPGNPINYFSGFNLNYYF
ncbi:TonB-dependent receptor [uncultured Algibacter sp.]|uniref:TonB-dependent receptor domain-containing protein n=1 Tax=uncultured Algibacter sp. TaxID=298659 RepID=UPI0026186C61|nr:TonB-dependent receptor [uncultured Algibacter sp.]